MFGLSRYGVDTKDVLVFGVGLFSLIQIRVMGTFGLSEILCLVSYFFVANPFSWTKDKGVTRLFLAAIIWLLGVFISDRYNGTNLTDSLKGFFNVFFLIALIPFVYWALYDKPRRMLYFWAGNAISSLFSFYYMRAPQLDEVGAEVWGVYAYYYLFIVASGILYYKGKPLLACAVIEGFAFWSLFHLSRNVFLTMTISVCVILFILSIKADNIQTFIVKYQKKLGLLLVVLATAFGGVSYTYEYLASNRFLGDRAYEKWYMQKHSRLGLASGRGDFVESVYLVSKKPIFGYGSYARNDNHILNEYYKENGIGYSSAKLYDRRLAGHSYLMGGWVFAGVLGLAFWVYMVILIFRFCRRGLLYDPKLIGINILLTFATLWNVFFSPFANRLNFLVYMVTIILLSNSKENYEKYHDENIDNSALV